MDNLFINCRILSLPAAKNMADAGRIEAEKQSVPGALVIVDEGGNLMYLECWNHAMIAA
jgi:uncharacterized protein GlcG (DUF336 family)